MLDATITCSVEVANMITQTQLLQSDIQNHSPFAIPFWQTSLPFFCFFWCFNTFKAEIAGLFHLHDHNSKSCCGHLHYSHRCRCCVCHCKIPSPGWKCGLSIKGTVPNAATSVLQGESIMGSDEVDWMVRFSSIVLEKIRAATNPSRMTPSFRRENVWKMIECCALEFEIQVTESPKSCLKQISFNHSSAWACLSDFNTFHRCTW